MNEQTRKLIRDYTSAIFVAVLVALLIRFFIIEAYRIPSSAMKPTMEAGDTIFVAKWPFGLRLPGSLTPMTDGRKPARGEVVVFSLPTLPGRDYIKRVVALPGDEVQLVKGRIKLNGNFVTDKPLNEQTCSTEHLTEGAMHGVCFEPPLIDDSGPLKVPEGSVFVLGDLRTIGSGETAKFHSWGVIPQTALKGRALWIWLSIDPEGNSGSTGWFPRFRFNRMLRRVQ